MTPKPTQIFLVVSLVVLAGMAIWQWGGVQTESSSQSPKAVKTAADSETSSSELRGFKGSAQPVVGEREIGPTYEAADAKPKNSDTEAPPQQANFEFHLTMQLVDASGAPVRERKVHLGYGLKEHKTHVPKTHTIPFIEKTDKEGRITRPIPFSSAKLEYIALWVYDYQNEAKAWVDPVAIAPDADIDLGQVALLQVRERFPVPWIAGRILDESKQPLEHVHGILNESAFYEMEVGVAPPLEEAGSWPGWYGTQFVFEPNGRFAAYGPPGLQMADVSFSSEGYESEHFIGIQVPHLDLQVEMAKRVRLRGTLQIPENGPPMSEYGVWLSQGDRGTGIRAGAYGQFNAPGTSRSLRLQITHPSMGHIVYSQEFPSAPNEQMGLGIVDISRLVQVLDVRLTDATHQPLANTDLHIEAEGVDSNGGNYKTDANGRLLTVFPAETEVLRIGKPGVAKVTVRISELGAVYILQ